jgi:hypothetical protein
METRDYSKFKFLNTNREINLKNVEKIKASVREFGIIPGRPVLIDGDGHIIDGQHRFVAFKELSHPIPYEVIGGDTISKAMALNSNQSQWQMIDYVKSYANQGNDNYRKLLKFNDKYKLGIIPSLFICFGTNYKSADVKKGKDYGFSQDAEQIAEYIDSLDDVPFKKSKSFVFAIINLYKKTKPEQREVIRQNILRVHNFSNTKDYTNAFENILNHKKKNNYTSL